MNHQQTLIQEDEASRIRALELESFIVEAPAGAGKTELLTQRYLKLLQTVSAPEEIIAITFTNKAAAEMRLRILDSLKLASDGALPPQPHKQITFALAQTALKISAQLGWQLLENPARLRITTIDALCGNLARQMPLLSRFGSQPMMCLDAGLHYQEAARRTLEMLEGDDDFAEVVAETLRHLDNDSAKLTELLVSMLRLRDQWLNHTQQLDAQDGAESALRHLLTQDLAQAARILTPAVQNQLMPLARFAASNLACEEPVALLLDWETPLPVMPEALALWRAVVDLLLTNSGTFRKEKGINKRNGFPAEKVGKEKKAELSRLIEALNTSEESAENLARIRTLPGLQHGDASWQLVATFARLLNLAVAHLWAVFQEVGEVDFIGVAERALQALEDESGATDLAMKLDYRIRHLLVDEFQDTSPTQVELLRRLTRGWQMDDGRTLFCVGDPMQSIYRFRKAEVGLFLQVAQSGIDHIRLTKLKLCRNNRSCPQVVDWINQAFDQAFPAEDSVSRGAIAYRAFVAGKPNVAGKPEADDGGVETHAVIVAADLSKAQAAMQEAIQVANIIEAEQYADPQRSIAVLVRARSHLHALVAEIRRERPHIKFQAVEIEALSGRQSIQDVLALTYALHHRADRVHWLAILRAPWCGLTLADLHVLAADNHQATIWSLMQDEARIANMSADGQTRLAHMREVLAQALAHQGRLRTRRWVEGVWIQLNGPACLWEAGDVRDVQAFFDLISQLEAGSGFSLPALEEQVLKLYAAPDAEADERLQFMTIHKSKGLEFDTVILPGLASDNTQQDQPLLLWEEVSMRDEFAGSVTELVAAPLMPKNKRSNDLPTPYDYLQGLEKERAQNESLRVLYVAATRTERKLHLVGIAKIDDKFEVKTPAAHSHLGYLWPNICAPFMQAAAAFAEQEPAQDTAVPVTGNFIPQLLRLLQVGVPERLANMPSASIFAGNSQKENDTLPDDHLQLEKHTGILAHRYMELIAQSDLNSWTSERLQNLQAAMCHWLLQQGHAQPAAEQAATRVVQALHTTLNSEQGRWVLQPREQAAAEYAVTTALAGNLSTQVIDRTFIEHIENNNKVRWIIDFKSTALEESLSEAELQREAEFHRPQLQRYAALFADEGLPLRTAVFFLMLGKLVEVGI
ncbi:MAG: UvrD-helicase domain-containing protein [Methylophilaceae bacterium]|nr:UvrD-helicase domain-containing protein [Methylophilaceae bacterium]